MLGVATPYGVATLIATVKDQHTLWDWKAMHEAPDDPVGHGPVSLGHEVGSLLSGPTAPCAEPTPALIGATHMNVIEHILWLMTWHRFAPLFATRSLQQSMWLDRWLRLQL
jgi:hypothetical protein